MTTYREKEHVSDADLRPELRAAVACTLSVRHIDQIATGYLKFSADELDDIRHDKRNGSDVIMEVLRW